jgi:hypothetical protein
VKAIDPGALLIDEMGSATCARSSSGVTTRSGTTPCTTRAHVLLTGEHGGYYARYGSVADLADELARPQGRRLRRVRPEPRSGRQPGVRRPPARPRPAARRVLRDPLAGRRCCSRERSTTSRHPFQYFTDHIDPRIAELTREGRRREFAEFDGLRSGEEIPDPQDPETFVRSKLDPADGDPRHLAYYRELLALRRELPDELVVAEVDEQRRLIRWRRGEVELTANFSDREQDGVPARTGVAVRGGKPVLAGP